MQPPKRITLKELTEITGLSRTTIYNVLNEKGNFSQETRKLVLDAMDKYHYRPNLNARNLARRKNFVVAYIGLSSQRDTYYNQDIQRGLSQALHQFEDDGLQLMNYTCSSGYPDTFIQKINQLEQDGIQNFILFSSPNSQITDRVQRLIDSGKNVVLLSNQLPVTGSLAFIGCDYYKSGLLCGQLIEKFCKAESRLQIFLNPVQHEDSSTWKRYEGIQDALSSSAKKISICEPFYFRPNQKSQRQEIYQVLKQRKIDAAVNIISDTGLICEQIKRISRSISMVSFDLYQQQASYLKEGILDAVIEQNLSGQAYEALKVMFEFLCYHKRPEYPVHYAPLNIVMEANLEYFL